MERLPIEYTVRGKEYIVYPIDKIQNATDAYVIGYLAADGAYSKIGKQKNFDRMSITSSQKFVIDGIIENYIPNNEAMDRSNRKISITNTLGKTYNYENRPCWEMHFPIRFTESLRKYGIVCNKPERVMAGIPKQFRSAYILGFMDGDGSIVVRHRKDCRTPRLSIHIITGAQKIALQLQNELANEYGIISSIYHRQGNKNYCELRINNTQHAIKFCEIIYSNLPDFYNFKKKQIFDSYMSCVGSGELRESDMPIRSQADE